MQPVEQQVEPASVVKETWETPELVKADVGESTMSGGGAAPDGLGTS